MHVHIKLSLTKQEEGHPNDMEAGGSTILFSESCIILNTKFVKDDFKKDFGIHVYDEYEEEYLEGIPKGPAIEPWSASGENQAAIQSQRDEIGKDNKCAEGEILPLCYSSFELIRHRLKAYKKKQKLEDMVHFIDLFGTEDDKDE